MRSFSIILFIIVGQLVLLSCAKGVTSSKSGDNNKINSYSEDLSSVRIRPNLEKEEIDSQEDLSPNAFMLEEPNNENENLALAFSQIAKHNDNIVESQGYRIQAFSGISRRDFEITKNYLMQNFPELDIYESYSQPTYRIKAGNFLEHLEAERIASYMSQEYTSAKVIQDIVDVKKSLKIN